MHLSVPLLEYLLYRAKGIPLSELQHLNIRERTRLLRTLEEICPEDIPLGEWNDALEYLCHAPGKEDSRAAKARLIELLSCPEEA